MKAAVRMNQMERVDSIAEKANARKARCLFTYADDGLDFRMAWHGRLYMNIQATLFDGMAHGVGWNWFSVASSWMITLYIVCRLGRVWPLSGLIMVH